MTFGWVAGSNPADSMASISQGTIWWSWNNQRTEVLGEQHIYTAPLGKNQQLP